MLGFWTSRGASRGSVWATTFALVLVGSLLPGPPAAAQPPTDPVVISLRASRRFERRGGTVTMGVFAGIFGTYGAAALGASFASLAWDLQQRRNPHADPSACESCIFIPMSATISLASTWMFIRVARRTRAYRAHQAGMLFVPVAAFDSRRGSLQLTLSATF